MLPPAPTPETLNWLAKGRLADRCLRAVRLWVLLHLFYAAKSSLKQRSLPSPFRYSNVRDRLFASTHSRAETAKVNVLTAQCQQANLSTCLCQQTLLTILENSPLSTSISHWQQTIVNLTDLPSAQVSSLLQQQPFATVHRSIRDDLAYLAETGWLKSLGQGRFMLVDAQQWPAMPHVSSLLAKKGTTPLSQLSVEQTWEVVRSLESLAFVKPNLEIIINDLWEQMAERLSERMAEHPQRSTQKSFTEPTQRIFIHLDYILSTDMQEQVDTLQEQIEQIWRDSKLKDNEQEDSEQNRSGIVQFDYGIKSGGTVPITVYPVCLHYARRAKYLSAYGIDPAGHFGWHNYRLDRILSPRLSLLSWQHPQVPTRLKKMHQTGTLPTSEDVSAALSQAWGFNFYLPRRLLIMRFSPSFAQRYVHNTDRHATFEPIAYSDIANLIKTEVKNTTAQKKILNILSKKEPSDQYYRAWIRLGDINIVMRLRDWRPNGEVIAPLKLRQQMYKEAQQECGYYEEQ